MKDACSIRTISAFHAKKDMTSLKESANLRTALIGWTINASSVRRATICSREGALKERINLCVVADQMILLGCYLIEMI